MPAFHPDMNEIYLDNNATTRPLPEVVAAMLDVLQAGFGNASSAHSAGDRARSSLASAREALASLVGAEPEHLLFTSGGTEANNLVLFSQLLRTGMPRRLVTSTVEHSSILKAAERLNDQGVEVVHLPVGTNGQISARDLAAALDRPTGLVSIQWVNNETGVTQPIAELAEISRERKVPFHTDAAQAVGKMAIKLSDSKIDYLSLSAHKFNGPQGVGALFFRDGRHLSPILLGGPQEMKLRAGTENTPGVVGLGAAARTRLENLNKSIEELGSLRDQFESRLREAVPRILVNGGTSDRVCNSTNIQFPGVDGQALVARLDQVGIRCSQSSACTNQRPEPSYVLRAMGLSEEQAYSSVRFSFSVENTAEELGRVVTEIAILCRALDSASLTQVIITTQGR